MGSAVQSAAARLPSSKSSSTNCPSTAVKPKSRARWATASKIWWSSPGPSARTSSSGDPSTRSATPRWSKRAACCATSNCWSTARTRWWARRASRSRAARRPGSDWRGHYTLRPIYTCSTTLCQRWTARWPRRSSRALSSCFCWTRRSSCRLIWLISWRAATMS